MEESSQSRVISVSYGHRKWAPQVNEPQRKGFGLRLITGALTPGRAELSFEPTGVVCRILVDLDHPPPENADESAAAR